MPLCTQHRIAPWGSTARRGATASVRAARKKGVVWGEIAARPFPSQLVQPPGDRALCEHWGGLVIAAGPDGIERHPYRQAKPSGAKSITGSSVGLLPIAVISDRPKPSMRGGLHRRAAALPPAEVHVAAWRHCRRASIHDHLAARVGKRAVLGGVGGSSCTMSANVCTPED